MNSSIYKNKIKTSIIFCLIFALVSIFVYYICNWTGYGEFALTFALGFSLLSSLISYWFSASIVLKINKAIPADAALHNEAYTALRRVCYNAGIPEPKLYIMNDPSPNAFATGRNPKNAVVCLTTGLVNKLDYYQLEGVIAHEVAHIKNYDILLSTVASVMIGMIIMVCDILQRSFFFRSFRNDSDDSSTGVIAGIISLIIIIITPIAGQLLRLCLSRNREYLADSTGASFTGNPEGLASALIAISEYSQPLKYASEATANMFISDPMYANSKKKRLNLFSTHPPIEERVERLRDMKYNY